MRGAKACLFKKAFSGMSYVYIVMGLTQEGEAKKGVRARHWLILTRNPTGCCMNFV
jgi:hypothetical protein